MFQPGGRGPDVSAAMAASGYGPTDHGIFRPEMFRERVLQGRNDSSFVHEREFSRAYEPRSKASLPTLANRSNFSLPMASVVRIQTQIRPAIPEATSNRDPARAHLSASGNRNAASGLRMGASGRGQRDRDVPAIQAVGT